MLVLLQYSLGLAAVLQVGHAVQRGLHRPRRISALVHIVTWHPYGDSWRAKAKLDLPLDSNWEVRGGRRDGEGAGIKQAKLPPRIPF